MSVVIGYAQQAIFPLRLLTRPPTETRHSGEPAFLVRIILQRASINVAWILPSMRQFLCVSGLFAVLRTAQLPKTRHVEKLSVRIRLNAPIPLGHAPKLRLNQQKFSITDGFLDTADEQMQEIIQKFDGLTLYLVWIGWISAVLFLLSLALVPVLLAKIPSDYFTRHSKSAWPSNKIRRIHYSLFWTIRNVLAVSLVLAGLLMLVLPGQGLLTIFLGLFTADFPGKRKLEQKLISVPSIHSSINWIREKRGVEPLLLPQPNHIRPPR